MIPHPIYLDNEQEKGYPVIEEGLSPHLSLGHFAYQIDKCNDEV